MSGVKDGNSVHYPCRHCMASKDEMGNVYINPDGVMGLKKHQIRSDHLLTLAKRTYNPSKAESSLGFVMDKSREVFDNIQWKSAFQIYCMTPMCILHVFLSHGIAEYAIQWTKEVLLDLII